MDNIKNVVIVTLFVLLACATVLLGLMENEVKVLNNKLIALTSASEQLLHDKQEAVDNVTKRANDFLKQARIDYEKSVNVNRVVKFKRVQHTKSQAVETNSVRTVQESAGVVEPEQVDKEKSDESDCMERYLQLWKTWEGLCLIYGCVD